MIKIETQQIPAGRVVLVRGEVDLDSSPGLLDEIRSGLAAGAVLVDLSGVEYMDSSGVAVLIQGVKLARRKGSDFRLRNPSQQVAGVLELSQLEDFFEYARGDETDDAGSGAESAGS